MTKPTILVTGATGRTGRAVVEGLRAQDWPVRAIVHRRDARSEALDRLGAETVTADLFDPEQIADAMRGTQRAYFCPPWHPAMLESATAFAAAARQARLEAVVHLSQWLAAPHHPAPHTRHAWLAERLFDLMPGTARITLNPGYFADSYLLTLHYASHLGVLPWPYGESWNAPPSNEDIARVAIAALQAPERHAGRAWRPTGPVLLSGPDMAAALSRVLGRRVRLMPMPKWMFLRAVRVAGLSSFLALNLRHYIEEHRRGTFALAAPNNDVLEATGAPAEPFETTAQRYAAQPANLPHLGNHLRTLREFLLVGVTPGFRLDQLDRALGGPDQPMQRLAVADPAWHREHGVPTTAGSLVPRSETAPA